MIVDDAAWASAEHHRRDQRVIDHLGNRIALLVLGTRLAPKTFDNGVESSGIREYLGRFREAEHFTRFRLQIGGSSRVVQHSLPLPSVRIEFGCSGHYRRPASGESCSSCSL